MIVEINIPNDKLFRWADTAKRLWQIPQIDNPDFVDIIKTPDIPEKIDEFTDNEWAKVGLLRFCNGQIHRLEEYDAKNVVDVPYEEILT